MLIGFSSVAEEGLPPANIHCQEVGLLIDSSVKLTQNFSQMEGSFTENAMEELTHAAVSALYSPRKASEVFPEAVNRIGSKFISSVKYPVTNALQSSTTIP